MKIILFGDSLLGNMKSSHIDIIETSVKNSDVYNCATGGITTITGMKKSEFISDLKSDVVVLSFGINDILKGLSIDEYMNNFKKILNDFKDSKRIVWIIPHVNDLKDVDGTKECNQKIDEYNQEIIKYCNENEIEYIDPFADFEIIAGKEDKLHKDDGIHLTDAGYSLLINALSNMILRV